MRVAHRALPTLAEIASAADVSRSLVSLAMRGDEGVALETRHRILEVAAQLGREPSPRALRPFDSSPQVIGVIVTELGNPFYVDIIAGAERTAAAHGYSIVVANGSRDPDAMAAHLRTFAELHVAGVVVASTWLPDQVLSATAGVFPVTVIGSTAVPITGVDTVSGDAADGVRQTIEHLVAMGHERIAFVEESQKPTSFRRRDAYLTHMERLYHGDATHSIHIDQFTQVPSQLIELVRVHHFTALVAANDLTAMRVLDLAERCDIAVPDELAVTGYDNTPYGRTSRPRLTTVDLPREHMGERAVELLLERFTGRVVDRNEHVRPLLVPRESTPTRTA